MRKTCPEHGLFRDTHQSNARIYALEPARTVYRDDFTISTAICLKFSSEPSSSGPSLPLTMADEEDLAMFIPSLLNFFLILLAALPENMCLTFKSEGLLPP